MHKLNLLKILSENFKIRFHLMNVFFVILPFIRLILILSFSKFKIIFGQISESIKNTDDGRQ